MGLTTTCARVNQSVGYRQVSRLSVVKLVGWSVGHQSSSWWLVGQSVVNRQVGWLVGHQVGWLVGHQVGWLVVYLVGRLVVHHVS